MRALVELNGPRVLGLALLVALCVPASGCKKAGSDSMSPESQDYGGEGADAATDPVAELDALEARMRALGLATADGDAHKGKAERAEAAGQPGASNEGEDADDMAGGLAADKQAEEVDAVEAAPTAAVEEPAWTEDEAGSRCGDLCDLSEAICQLEVRICSLSESHASDPIYADACERAVDDCDTAGHACDNCDA